jgi:hypothetical protein
MRHRKVGRPKAKHPLRTQLNIRFKLETMARLHELAAKKRIPVATMLRNVVLDYLDGVK